MRKTSPNKEGTRARKLPATGTASLQWEGRTLPMIQERNGVWRVRSRSKSFPVDIGTGVSDLALARQKARQMLAARPVSAPARGTLEEAVAAYRTLPKKCSDVTAEGNISRLRSVVATAFDGAALDTVKVSRLPDLWHTYVAKRQGRAAADYSRRERRNVSINTAMRQAASIFRRKLWPHYARAGIILPPDCALVEYLPAVTIPRAEADDAALCAAWRELEHGDLWAAVGLARFAGLRAGEILALRGKWIEQRDGATVVKLMDREADGHFTKTGRTYTALILDADLAAWLSALGPEAPAITATDAARWLGREPQKWLRKFMPGAGKPLHRLRGLYADQIKRETESAMLAKLAGLKAASEALGHTTTETTERHYTTP